MRGQLPDISPSSGAFRATFPPKGEGFPGGQPPLQRNPTGKRHGTVKTVPYKPAGNLHFSPLYLTSRLFVGRGLDPSLPLCVYCKSPRRGGVAPPYRAIKYTARYNGNCNIAGRFVGAAYMPPVATIRILRTTGQTARNGQDRSLQPAGKAIHNTKCVAV